MKKQRVVVGRTIGEKRERLETANERAAARKKDKRQKTIRIVAASLGFLVFLIIVVVICVQLLNGAREEEPEIDDAPVSYVSTIEIVDESASVTKGKISNRMQEYIAQIEVDLKELGYRPSKAVIPASSIREVDFYLEGYTGYLKTIIDRGAGVTTEDADRMIKYLAEQGINDFSYIDVRIDGKAYWQ